MAEAVTTRQFTPKAGCPRCTALDTARRRARATHDRSAETDARVLIKKHMGGEHGTVLEAGWT
ncbi:MULTISPECIES: hypothetical protein [Streptomyces]|uniref:Uncharacterized protein n=2 Tax=Streptomyces rimosus subsp. rimosus TaxID=132474 RepID=L8EXT2_STRR1|nr:MULTISPECIES: hypothetical protein [Streptomyces]KOG71594.1 hypothetical protein ADK78_23705 [Kitasatospora aureofaciens]MYT48184.1 hypothetical protein [Streptomyces sp. SID5471]KEF07952.1 hypothetical protein DF17_06590 [Streptomyces rimosus]KOT34405.1 hypothetical protein ADK84_24105 [Streptomyces sp. NRRL WC-3701]KOT34812.1 hypothetical protein ADK42_21665 [Streptomyces rimosus subsp. rimosus]